MTELSQHFTWHDALYLPRWKVEHIPSAAERANIIKIAQTMEKIRALYNKPISVHCWLRPVLNSPGHPMHGHDYNALVGGAPASMHKTGCAVDFDISGVNCDDVRLLLSMKLSELGLRMEKKPGSLWVHVDNKAVKTDIERYFLP